MRLLNARTRTLEEFVDNEAPPYTILSHTWGSNEITFKDMSSFAALGASTMHYGKILNTCEQALKDGLEYAWVDTCCIDKSSSEELSEAINSMFRWYENSRSCYVYLDDVDSISDMSKSLWFKRGWTLQELLAPYQVVFYSRNWAQIATRSQLSEHLSEITGIEVRYLKDKIGLHASSFALLSTASVAQRMSWAAFRETKRPEDISYCLMGIFGVNMPLLYGEGDNAFLRLQEEIIKQSDDESIFAWQGAGLHIHNVPLKLSWPSWRIGSVSKLSSASSPMTFLAKSPAAFKSTGHIIPWDCGELGLPFSVTNKGLEMTMRLSSDSPPFAVLKCQPRDDPTTLIAIRTFPIRPGYYMRASNGIRLLNFLDWPYLSIKTLHLSVRQATLPEPRADEVAIPGHNMPATFEIREVFPLEAWSPETRRINFTSDKDVLLHLESAQKSLRFIAAIRSWRRAFWTGSTVISLALCSADPDLSDLMKKVKRCNGPIPTGFAYHIYGMHMLLTARIDEEILQGQSLKILFIQEATRKFLMPAQWYWFGGGCWLAKAQAMFVNLPHICRHSVWFIPDTATIALLFPLLMLSVLYFTGELHSSGLGSLLLAISFAEAILNDIAAYLGLRQRQANDGILREMLQSTRTWSSSPVRYNFVVYAIITWTMWKGSKIPHIRFVLRPITYFLPLLGNYAVETMLGDTIPLETICEIVSMGGLFVYFFVVVPTGFMRVYQPRSTERTQM